MASQVSSPRPNTPLPTGNHDYQGYRRQVTAANMENHHGAPQNLQRPNYNTPLPTGDHDYQGYRLQVTAANMENHHGAPQNLQRPNYNIKSYEAAEIHGGILTEWSTGQRPTSTTHRRSTPTTILSSCEAATLYGGTCLTEWATRGPVANGKEIRSKKPPRGKW
ncbi:hypothetical protein FF1_021918 [Malus domestica]|uniref:uncharacterized protein LOC126608386 n=1 Tax=Malus sylvestris TaxID=3752 RepID=UPI0010A9A48A|nr:uncharacterized protein LOC114821915 [Malus domestica]XP_050132220.1 uncharacterized protein LOC126608386 [Malus sylvestris]